MNLGKVVYGDMEGCGVVVYEDWGGVVYMELRYGICKGQ